jgi:hypothetical protein
VQPNPTHAPTDFWFHVPSRRPTHFSSACQKNTGASSAAAPAPTIFGARLAAVGRVPYLASSSSRDFSTAAGSGVQPNASP